MDLKQLFMQEILPQLITLLGILAAAAVVYAKSKLKKLIDEKAKNEAINGALSWANSLVWDVVQAASQTTVKELKQALADGKITDEEYRAGLKKIKDGALQELLSRTVGKLLGSGAVSSEVEARNLIMDKIEAAVPQAKALQAAAKGANPQPAKPNP